MSHWIDGHIDLAYLAVSGRNLLRACEDPAAACVSLPDLRAGGISIIFGTIFTEVNAPDQPYGYADHDDLDGAERSGLAQLHFYESLEEAGEIRIVRTAANLVSEDPSDTRLRVVILMEGADPIRSADHLQAWWDRGVRMIGLSWALGSRYAGGNARAGRLTAAGRDLVQAMDALGIVHDLSHLPDESVDDVLTLAQGPVMASHSNARAQVEDRQRHLSDETIQAIASRDGVIGLNLCGRFLNLESRATIDDAVRHVRHVAAVGESDTLTALGSDFDGGFPPTSLPTGLEHPRDLAKLTDALARSGWNEAQCARFRHGNWERFLQRCLPST